MPHETRTCPICNMKVIDGKCTNPHGTCAYRGSGLTTEERQSAWATHGVEERTTGAMYDYTGRD